jgi:hypothetical protein
VGPTASLDVLEKEIAFPARKGNLYFQFHSPVTIQSEIEMQNAVAEITNTMH